MATFPLSGTIAGHSSATGLIDVSHIGSNEPTSSSGGIVSYVDPTAATTGTVTPGVADGMPNSASLPLTPFLRTSFVSDQWSSDLGSGVELVVPSGSGILKGDLMVATVTAASAGSVPTSWLSSGWTLQGSVVDTLGAINASVWTRVATDTEDGRFWRVSGGSTSQFAQVRVYGNAVFDRAIVTENALGSLGESATATLGDAHVNGLVAYVWTGNFGFFPSLVANIPDPLGNIRLNLNSNYVGTVSADLAVVSPIQPARTALLTPSPGHSAFGKVFQVVVSLKPLEVFRYADVSLEEAVGSAQDAIQVDSYVHLMGSDEHSPQTVYGFTKAGMNGSGTLYTYERWVRVRFDPSFNTVRAFRFWAPNLTEIPLGWSVRYGTAPGYSAPVNTASSIATSPVPTSDPGQASPNAGGEIRLAGTGTQYSDWIVLQASANSAVVGPGPVLGFSLEGTLIPIEFAFTWTET